MVKVTKVGSKTGSLPSPGKGVRNAPHCLCIISESFISLALFSPGFAAQQRRQRADGKNQPQLLYKTGDPQHGSQQ